MEEKDAQTIIPEDEFVELIVAAKTQDSTAIIKLIELFEDDIKRLSKFIYLPDEDAFAEITTEFLEFVMQGELYND
ncbi:MULTISPECIES: helix-turn-helix domain-containing protein [Paenibacillus]|uniref:helix-turn-helix domain-containing protein n=1 Tax=Paenibacillus TaxID=44249 RepID=UPI00042A03F4|nr:MULTISPECIES: helix-turn-helix domain-containing protein [Paenibacillus]MDN8591379.1 helix-turn-helix domain-containing protein [Paenibacillus sp. 11B]OZQ66869.1 hypothetical protein CA599_18005 [Paenibacillus taichungensis]HBU83673.1 hypothetical protein [Paenibacillus sp.]